MKTTWNSSPIIRSWFSSIVNITCSICPHLFLQTHKGIWWPHPVFQSTLFSKLDIPLPAPDYNPSAQALPFQQAKDYWAMLFALHTDYSKGTAPVTSDDLLVILDSGWDTPQKLGNWNFQQKNFRIFCFCQVRFHFSWKCHWNDYVPCQNWDPDFSKLGIDRQNWEPDFGESGIDCQNREPDFGESGIDHQNQEPNFS